MNTYRSHPGVSQTALKVFAANPMLYKRMFIDRTEPWPPPTKEMILGQKVEAYIRGEATKKVIRVPDSVLTKNGQKRGSKYDAWKAEVAPDVEPELCLTDKQWDAEFSMYKQIKANIEAHEAARYLLLGKSGTWHTQVVWHCPITGIQRKGELDRWFPHHCNIADLKCVNDPTPAAFAKQVENMGWHVQAATYIEGVEATVNPVRDVCYGFVVIRNSPPYDVHTYQLPDHWIVAGREWNQLHMRKLKQARKSDKWTFPNHGKVVELERPKWAAIADADRQIEINDELEVA